MGTMGNTVGGLSKLFLNKNIWWVSSASGWVQQYIWVHIKSPYLKRGCFVPRNCRVCTRLEMGPIGSLY